jgi:hypothetical protein
MAIATTSPIPQSNAAAAPTDAVAGGAARRDDSGFSFHDLLNIVNPLQHFPIVSTLYRKLTGDTIKPLERLAGDTLYGGWIGLASSVANLVFEKATGKDFGDTVLALVDGGNDAKPAAPQTTTADNRVQAVKSSVTGAHIDPALGQRALYAYRRSMGMTAQPVAFSSSY